MMCVRMDEVIVIGSLVTRRVSINIEYAVLIELFKYDTYKL